MSDRSDRVFWRGTVGSAFGLALGVVWTVWGFSAFLLCTVFVVLGSLAVRIINPD